MDCGKNQCLEKTTNLSASKMTISHISRIWDSNLGGKRFCDSLIDGLWFSISMMKPEGRLVKHTILLTFICGSTYPWKLRRLGHHEH